MADPLGRPPRQLGGELVIPVIAVVFTLYYFSTILSSPWTAQVSAFLIGGVLLFVCAVFFVRCLTILKNGEGTFGFQNLFSIEDIRTGRIGLFATTLGFCVFIDRLGFTLTTFLFLFLSMVILSKGAHWLRALIVSTVMAIGGWALFIVAFDTRFPRGWFEETMAAVMSNG